jgi:site-specific DNA recombinase
MSWEFPRDPAGVTVEEQEAAVVRDIFAWYVQESGTLLNLSKRLRELGIVSPSGKRHWSTATLRLLLTNPAYTGQVFAGRVRSVATQQRRSPLQVCGHERHTEKSVPRSEWIAVATIPALIGQETFDLAQGKLAQNRQRSKRNNTAHEYLLRSLVSCGVCRLACRGRQVPSGHSYYLSCGKTQVFAQGRAEKCPACYIPVSQLDDIVWKDLSDLFFHPQHVTDALHHAHSGQWIPHEMQARRESIRRGVWWSPKSRQWWGKNKTKLNHTRICLFSGRDLCWRLIVQRLMQSLVIIKREVVTQIAHSFRDALIVLGIHLLIFDTAPQALYKNIV